MVVLPTPTPSFARPAGYPWHARLDPDWPFAAMPLLSALPTTRHRARPEPEHLAVVGPARDPVAFPQQLAEHYERPIRRRQC